MIRRPCSKCETTDFPKYRRMKLRKNGQRTESMASYCTACHSEEQKIREERRYEKKLAYNRAWRKANRDKVNAYARADYEKNKDAINEKQREKYVPKPRSPRKYSHPKTLNTGWHKNKFNFGKMPGKPVKHQPPGIPANNGGE